MNERMQMRYEIVESRILRYVIEVLESVVRALDKTAKKVHEANATETLTYKNLDAIKEQPHDYEVEVEAVAAVREVANGYKFLVVVRHPSDDVPIALFAEREQAVQYAHSIEMLSDWERKMFAIDSMPVSVAIATFCDGRIIGFEVVRIFDDYRVWGSNGPF